MRFTLAVASAVLFYASNVLAQVTPVDTPFSAGAEVAKIGLGVASFLALVWFLRWMATELKAAREQGIKAQESAQTQFLNALAAQHRDHAEEMRLLREHNERQVVRLHEAIEDVRGGNGRER